MAKDTVKWLVILGLIGLGIYYFIGATEPTTQQPDTSGLAPSDLTTTVTINTKDALATSDTNAEVLYYVFKTDTGEFYNSGSTHSDGQDSFDVQWGGEYDVIAFNDSSKKSYHGFLPERTSFIADADEGSVKTINMELIKLGGTQISAVQDPVDLNANISCATGSTQSWQVIWKSNHSNAGILNPILSFSANQTGVDSDGVKITSSGWDEMTCPARFANETFAIYKRWCFRFTGDLGEGAGVVTSAHGLQTTKGTIKYHDTNDPGCGATACTSGACPVYEIQISDEQMYAKPGYVTNGVDYMIVAAEDDSDTDLGSEDSAKGFLGIAG